MGDALQQYLDVATEAALAGGAIVQAYAGKVKIEEKGRIGDLVTLADRAAEAEVLAVIQRHFPDHAILAEESGSRARIRASFSGPLIRWMAQRTMLTSIPAMPFQSGC